ncbi:hypothetical protein ACH4S8_44400 [Streptomyces sp. NPDC021080]|uniref:hypothetical protein n=1 Tax=Streptomyces sp. NPDC021080 TaxID=3365110 RepID=UPI0037AE3225
MTSTRRHWAQALAVLDLCWMLSPWPRSPTAGRQQLVSSVYRTALGLLRYNSSIEAPARTSRTAGLGATPQARAKAATVRAMSAGR